MTGASCWLPHRPELAPPPEGSVGGLERCLSLAPGVEMAFCWCPPGSFVMGSPEEEEERSAIEGPQHSVGFTEGFWLAKHPVTQAQWKTVMGENPSRKDGGPWHPVDNVSWNEAQGFCQKLALYLPTEAQWEYACRAGTATPFGIGGGNYLNSQMADFRGNFPYGAGSHSFQWLQRTRTLPVGEFPPNAWGLHDMHGQLWEWCEDSSEVYRPDENEDVVFAGTRRNLRGGAWYNQGRLARSACRSWDHPEERGDGHGFRPSSTQPERRETEGNSRSRKTSKAKR